MDWLCLMRPKETPFIKLPTKAKILFEVILIIYKETNHSNIFSELSLRKESEIVWTRKKNLHEQAQTCSFRPGCDA